MKKKKRTYIYIYIYIYIFFFFFYFILFIYFFFFARFFFFLIPPLVLSNAYITGPSCSKLTTSLVNDSLKFKSSDTQICWNFLLKKCATHIFSAKNIRILYIESAKTVNEMTLNKLVKLTMLWTTGPWFLNFNMFILLLFWYFIYRKKNNPVPGYKYLLYS